MTWLAIGAAAAAALLALVLVGLPRPPAGSAAGAATAPGSPADVASPTAGSASSPGATPPPSPRSITGVPERYQLGNGVVVEQNSAALWTEVRKALPGEGRQLDFVIGACPGNCAEASLIGVSSGTFELGLPVGFAPCPGMPTGGFECAIYQAGGGEGVVLYEAVRSREELLAVWLARNGGAAAGERQVEGIVWTVVKSNRSLVGLGVDGERLVVVAADRGSLSSRRLEERFGGFLHAVRFTDPALTWHGAEIRTPDGWVIRDATEQLVVIERASMTTPTRALVRIRAVAPGERVWVMRTPATTAVSVFESRPQTSFSASGTSLDELRAAIEAELGPATGRTVAERPAWTWRIDATFFSPAVDIGIVPADGVYLVVTTIAAGGSAGFGLDRLLDSMTFTEAPEE